MLGTDMRRCLHLRNDMLKTCSEIPKTPQVNKVKLGKAMRQLRHDANLSLRLTAKTIGVSAPYLSDCELGFRQLSIGPFLRFLKFVTK